MSFFLERFLSALVRPLSLSEDRARSEFILNVLLVGSIVLSGTSLIVNTVKWFLQMEVPVSVGMIFSIFLLFLGLYLLSRKGYPNVSSYILVGTFYLISSFMNYRWGVDLPTGLLTYGLVIVMSGVLVSSRFAFFITALIGGTVFVLQLLQGTGAVIADYYWRQQPWETGNTIVTIVTFGLMALVSWLSNREIEKSLIRARKSEGELKQERDSLEIKVEERTREVKEVQAEKMSQLYRFAEFGRLSSGLFHDLINPLNAVSLNVERLQHDHKPRDLSTPSAEAAVSETAEYVDRAVRAAKNLENLVASVRKQLMRQEQNVWFDIHEEIIHVVDILLHKARASQVALSCSDRESIQLFGDSVKFNQAMLNLVANGIDAYPSSSPARSNTNGERSVRVTLHRTLDQVVIRVIDQGIGIPENVRSKIFEPFFTTKAEGHGIGLSMTKRIIEKDFHGTLQVESEEERGTTFVIHLPIPKRSIPLVTQSKLANL